MSDRVSVDRKEFQAFVAENQELVKRYQELLDKLNSLREINRDLQEKLDLAERRLDSSEKKVGVGVQAGDDRLRKARATMARLEKEIERHLSEPDSYVRIKDRPHLSQNLSDVASSLPHLQIRAALTMPQRSQNLTELAISLAR